MYELVQQTDKKQMFQVLHDRSRCKKCGGCQLLMPKMWKKGLDGKSTLVQQTFSQKDLKKFIEVAEVCCGNCIQYKNLKTGDVSQIKGHTRVW